MHIVCHRMLYVVCHAYHSPKRSKPRVDIQGVGGYYATLGIRTLTIFWMELPATSRSLLPAYSMHSIHPRATFAVGIWWTIQMPVSTFLSSNRRYQGWRCFFHRQPTLNPNANLIFGIVSCILQWFWCIGWVCWSLSCLCLYKRSSWLLPPFSFLTPSHCQKYTALPI